MKKITKTDCSKCYFASLSDSKQTCKFDIINSIKDSKDIDIKNGYYYINNYRCVYAFPKEKVKEIEETFPDINLLEYTKYRVYIKYYLIIDNLDNKLSVESIAEYINNLSIKPKVISIFTRSANMVEDIEKFDKTIDNIDGMVWRLHNFKNQDIDYANAIHSVLSTSSHLKDCGFIWCVKNYQLSKFVETKSIERINFLANVAQPDIGIFYSVDTKNHIDGIFLTKNNYSNLIGSYSQNLDEAMEFFLQENKNSVIIKYDD